ncbi:membrane-spanning 4-domains subfamily A member 4A-like [Nannospalax galili]|uniref:membrane-spanning 4-domains subfamily A member 4A-like n=1 Tax=Nannospalax galili TaxID=1026970 RepID=UPI0004ED1A02|nr:membrane-spanning 4-domains subfamily A member 4A-like [Nannospalax galili]
MDDMLQILSSMEVRKKFRRIVSNVLSSEEPSHLWKGLAEKFLKGEPKVLGVLQILIALMILSLGIIIMTLMVQFYESHPVMFGLAYPAWGSVLFIVSGAFSMAAGIRTNKGLVRSSMGLNIASSVLASLGILFSVNSLNILSFEYPVCRHSHIPDTCILTMSILVGMNALVIILSLFEFCIAVSLSAFGCKVTCCHRSGVMVIIPSNPSMAEAASPPSFQGGLIPPVTQEKNVPENLH